MEFLKGGGRQASLSKSLVVSIPVSLSFSTIDVSIFAVALTFAYSKSGGGRDLAKKGVSSVSKCSLQPPLRDFCCRGVVKKLVLLPYLS